MDEHAIFVLYLVTLLAPTPAALGLESVEDLSVAGLLLALDGLLGQRLPVQRGDHLEKKSLSEEF